MSEVQKLLEIRNNRNKPSFTRQEYPARKKLDKVWRKPKGIHSKMRDKKRGKKVQPTVGWKAPRIVRGLTRDGLVPVMINNLKDIVNLKQTDLAVISSKIGMRKKIEILKKLKEKKVKVLDTKDVEKAISSLKEKLQVRKKEKQERLNSKTEEEKKLEKKPEPKEQKQTEEEKKKQEKEEKRKVLEGGQ